MRIVVLAAALAAIATPVLAQGSNSVRGHIRRDGTYVAPHYRTNPNRTTYDNWSTKPNTNPYTGQQGTRSPAPLYGGSSGSIYGGNSNYGAPKRTCGYYGC